MLDLKYNTAEISSKREYIRQALFVNSENIKDGNIKSIAPKDLYLLYGLYDKVFLDRFFIKNFKGNIKFSLSKQLTNAAGITKVPKNIAEIPIEKVNIEIKMSLNFIFDYYKLDRQKEVNGIVSKDSLDALMLVFEHELCHFIEFLLFYDSSCKQKRFKTLANNIFGHTNTYHELVSKKEINQVQYGLKLGDMVTFNYEGKLLIGRINAINKRATVMVENKNGKYIDNKERRYAKYYVPFEFLTKK